MSPDLQSTNTPMPSCPLCLHDDVLPFHQDAQRRYVRCQSCHLVFVPPAYFLSADEEKARYDWHQNSPEDHGYCNFLNRLYAPLQQRLSPGSHGLDFGSGPGPTLSGMFEASGHSVQLFDPFYANYPQLLEQRYDFITATEVLEHLQQPGRELERLWQCLKPGAWLAVMTQLVIDQKAFSTWRYTQDQTHICFFSRETFTWLANKWSAELSFADAGVMLLQKRV